jgi:hypothetical protein
LRTEPDDTWNGLVLKKVDQVCAVVSS